MEQANKCLMLVMFLVILDSLAAQSCTYESGIDYRFGDIGVIKNIYTPCDCANQCNYNRYCKAWTHESSNCYLKYGIAYRMSHSGRSSGVRTASFNYMCSTFSGSNYVGGDIGGVEAYTIEECCYRCALNPSCQAFSYQTVSTEIKGYCYFKSTSSLTLQSYSSISSGAVVSRP